MSDVGAAHSDILRTWKALTDGGREELLRDLGCVTTAELLAELHEAAQVIADQHNVPPGIVREILLAWEVTRPTHP